MVKEHAAALARDAAKHASGWRRGDGAPRLPLSVGAACAKPARLPLLEPMQERPPWPRLPLPPFQLHSLSSYSNWWMNLRCKTSNQKITPDLSLNLPQN